MDTASSTTTGRQDGQALVLPPSARSAAEEHARRQCWCRVLRCATTESG